LDGYCLFRRDRGSKRGGVAIYISNKIATSEVNNPLLSDKKEQIWCEIEVNNEKFLLGCLYRPNMNDDVTVINNSISEAKRLVDTSFYSGVLFCGDFNFPSLDWNAEGAIFHDSAEPNAQKFVDTIDDLFLSQFVIEPTFQLDNKTCINTLDLIFSDCPERISDSIWHLPPLGK
jgi:hypothetical protein